MSLFANFVDRVTKKRVDSISARAEKAGAKGVEVAQSIVPVRTGYLKSTIGFTWRQSDMVLVLHADASYAAEIARRSPYMKAGRAAMMSILSGVEVNTRFANVPEKYQAKARLLSGKHVIIGHRKVR